MSSTTTAVPSGSLANGPNWCIQNMIDIFGSDEYPYDYNECANTTRGMKKSDFQTICCDGEILDISQDLWQYAMSYGNMSQYDLNIENLVCCRSGGQRLPGGILPFREDGTECDFSMVPTPLASLAATNTDNAQLFLVTYESGTVDETGGPADWTVTKSPTCLWVETAYKSISMVDVTVPAAKIKTLPPPTTDRWGYLVTSATTGATESTKTTVSISPTSNEPSFSKKIAGAAPISAAPSSNRLLKAALLASVLACFWATAVNAL